MSMKFFYLLVHVTSEHFSSHFKAYYKINTSGQEQDITLHNLTFFYLGKEFFDVYRIIKWLK